MRSLQRKKERKNRGITLVALIVTIVILIILATISINALFGDEGIIKQAQRAKDMTVNATKQEEELLKGLASSLETVYAKLYAYDDGSGNILEFSSQRNFVDNTSGITLLEDYGNVGNEKYYFSSYTKYEEDEETGETIKYYIEDGYFPPWL